MKNFLLLLLASFVVGCGSSRPNLDTPKWYNSALSTDELLVAVGEADSRKASLAVTAAGERARVELAREVGVQVENLFKDFQEQTGDVSDPVMLEQITDVSRTVTDRVLHGSRITQKKTQSYEKPDGSDADEERDVYYHAYVMVELSRDRVNEAALSALRSEEELYTRFRAAQSFEELERAVGGSGQ